MNLSWNRVFSRLLQGSVMVLLIVPCRSVAAEGFSLPVETAKVVRDTLVNSVQAVGTLRANESVVIRPEIEGRITKINFSEGGAIKRGELLIALDDSIYAAELRQSEARLALGRSNYKRATTLKKQGYGSEQDRDQTASELQVNQAEVVLAKARLEKTRIMAPFDGLLGLRLVSVGDYLKTGDTMMFAFILALGFIYLVLAAQFESFIDPFIILIRVPLAIGGALLALTLTGGTLNIYSQIGMITLVGLITKHGILIVEFANQIQRRGSEKFDAVIEAASLRLRPILMTTAAMVLGAIPLALASGAGAEGRQQIGWVIVGGMSIGTLFTLFVVPVVYSLIARTHESIEGEETA